MLTAGCRWDIFSSSCVSRSPSSPLVLHAYQMRPFPTSKVTISAATCLPLLAIAFNLHRIGQWWAEARERVADEWRNNRSRLLGVLVPLALAGSTVAILVPIWTSELTSVIKAAVTACLAVFLLVGVLMWSINALMRSTTRGRDSSTTTSYPRSESIVDD